MKSFLQSLIPGFVLLMSVFFPTLVFSQPLGSIKGSVSDAATLEPLVGVNIVVEGTFLGAASDANGNFTILNVPAGVYVVRVQYLGYETRSFTDIVVSTNRSSNIEVRLRESVLTGNEITVSAGYFQRDLQNPISQTSFNPEELRRSPGSGQELSRVLAALPGVAAVGEVSQDIMVRGGSPNENAFYIDNILMPGVVHFSMPGGSSNGPIGIVNTDLIADVRFSSGGYQSGYGQKLSSVSEITYRDGNRNGFQGDVLFSLAGMGLTAEGGVADQRGSYIISARRSYLDLIADAINTGGAPRYNDIQGKFTFDVDNRNRLSALLIYGQSLFKSTPEQAIESGLPTYNELGSQQFTGGINHRYLWKGSGYTETSVSYSSKTDDLQNIRLEDGLNSELFDIRNQYAALRSVSRYVVSPRLNLEFGGEIQIERHVYDYFIRGYRGRNDSPRPDLNLYQEIDGVLGGVFGSVTFLPVRQWSITTGLRTDYTSHNGNLDISPRISTNYDLTERLSLNAAFGVYYQSNSRYLMSQASENQKLDNMRSIHWVGGVAYLLTSDTRLTVEVYNKQYDQIPMFSGNTSGELPIYIPDDFMSTFSNLSSDGKAYARGVDVLLQKKLAENFYGMVSVSYFRSKYQAQDGEWYNRNFDNRYLFNVIGGYRPNNRYEFSARWSYQGGRPFTPIDVIRSTETGDEIYDLSRFNGDRMPAFHSLYLRVDRRFFFNRTSLVTFLETWNTYGRNNIAGYYWSGSKQEVVDITQFGFIPVVGVKFEF